MVIDLSMLDFMDFKRINSLAYREIAFVMVRNRALHWPVALYLTGYKVRIEWQGVTSSETLEMCEKRHWRFPLSFCFS